mmetsp:Transcript_2574/g.4685  ORF Transcript_2574/g.4685 Transcript_2574/m.4685 type:complete len:133 (+) Transcript_2574:198-596(+)
MVKNFSQQRSEHGPNAGAASTFRKILYAFVAIMFMFIIYSTKFLFDQRYASRQNTVIEQTGRSRRREKADAIQAARHNLRTVEGGDRDVSLSVAEDSIFQFDIPNSDGKYVNIGDTFAGKFKLMLIVNVASK